mmetsp:Transcript_35212/g.91396  ORF Transcript_35212/g.91396 Transcript_35212/m.91396 type:complete len:200 (+) Transcript_35212:311-910(+)
MVAVFGDSNCLDVNHLRSDCFWMLEELVSMASTATDDTLASALASTNGFNRSSEFAEPLPELFKSVSRVLNFPPSFFKPKFQEAGIGDNRDFDRIRMERPSSPRTPRIAKSSSRPTYMPVPELPLTTVPNHLPSVPLKPYLKDRSKISYSFSLKTYIFVVSGLSFSLLIFLVSRIFLRRTKIKRTPHLEQGVRLRQQNS